jgi:hypothetical protein
MPDVRHLWNRGKPPRTNWYLKLPIPRPLRERWPVAGKDYIVKPLDTGDLTVAQRRRDELTVAYRRVFDRLEAGERLTAEQIEAEIAEAINPPPPTIYVPLDEAPPEILKAQERYKAWWQRAHAGQPSPPPIEIAWRQRAPATPAVEPIAVEPTKSETISAALEAWLADPLKSQRPMTAQGHRMRANRFIKAVGDIPLADVTRSQISDFLATLGDNATRTRNAYQVTLWSIFKSAKLRGRYSGDNPAEGLKRQLTDDEKDSKYDPFTMAELSTLLADAKPEVKPAAYGVQSALQWAAVIGPYAGMRIEELAAMDAADVYQEIADEAGKDKVWVFDVHNGGNRALKNRPSIRKIPIHSELIRIGFLDYVKALPKGGKLFPGLVARKSKGGKLGAHLGEEFRDWLIRLGVKRDMLTYHSFRHNVADAMDAAKVYPPHKSRVLGHSLGGKGSGGQAGMTGHYGRGPGLKLLAEAVKAIAYEGLRIKVSKK